MLVGKHAVLEALRTDMSLDVIYINKAKPISSFGKIGVLAKEKGIVVKFVPVCKLDHMSQGVVHQGVVATETSTSYVRIKDILQKTCRNMEDPFLLLTDGIQDPHNLGALIRTAESMGVNGVILPKRNNASISPVVAKASAGAVSHMMIARETNLTNAIKELQREGVWVYGADMDGVPVNEVNLHGPIALVIGSEGSGLHRLVKETCDNLISIPMFGKIESLNASVAGSILLYEIAKQRENTKK